MCVCVWVCVCACVYVYIYYYINNIFKLYLNCDYIVYTIYSYEFFIIHNDTCLIK